MTLTKLCQLHLIRTDRSIFVVIVTLAKYNKDSKSFDSIYGARWKTMFFSIIMIFVGKCISDECSH